MYDKYAINPPIHILTDITNQSSNSFSLNGSGKEGHKGQESPLFPVFRLVEWAPYNALISLYLLTYTSPGKEKGHNLISELWKNTSHGLPSTLTQRTYASDSPPPANRSTSESPGLWGRRSDSLLSEPGCCFFIARGKNEKPTYTIAIAHSSSISTLAITKVMFLLFLSYSSAQF